MTLTDDKVYLVVIALLAVAIIGGALVSRIITKRWWGILLHVVVIALSSTLCALALGLVLNRQNLWYENVKELLNTAPQGKDAVVAAAPPAFAKESVSPAPVETGKGKIPLPSPGRQLQTFQVPASIGEYKFNVRVVLPVGYFDAANATKTYPVLMLGTGYPGKFSQWTERVGIATMAEQAYQEGKIGRFIAVIPELFPDAIDTECMDGPTGQFQLETFLAKDLPEYLDARFRLRPDRTSWSWIGISSGGYCALFQAIHHSDRYAGAATLGGYLQPDFGNPRPPFEVSGQRLAYMDLIRAAEEKQPSIALWMFNTNTEGKDIIASKELRQVSKKASITLVHTVGSHSWDTWTPRIPGVLEWTGKTLPGFARSAN